VEKKIITNEKYKNTPKKHSRKKRFLVGHNQPHKKPFKKTTGHHITKAKDFQIKFLKNHYTQYGTNKMSANKTVTH